MEGLVEGRIVHFVLDKTETINESSDSGTEGKIEIITCRPAIIVNAWGGKLEDGMINLQVFLDGLNDYEFAEQKMFEIAMHAKGLFKYNPTIENKNIHLTYPKESNMPLQLWYTSIKYSENKEVGTWHWPERN